MARLRRAGPAGPRGSGKESVSGSDKLAIAPGKIGLFDVELYAMKAARPRAVAAELARLKVFSTAEAAAAAIRTTPTILARYMGPNPSQAVVAALKSAGAEVRLSVSQLRCPHCGFAVRCEGEPAPGRRGLLFTCRACRGLTALDTRLGKFHPVLRCASCSNPVELPVGARPGIFPCRCGAQVEFAPVQQAKEETPEAPPFDEEAPLKKPGWLRYSFAVSLVVLAITAAGIYNLVRGGPDIGMEARPAPQDRPAPTTAYTQFTAQTGQEAVFAALGSPERESMSTTGEHRVLFYRRHDLCVVLRRSGDSFLYRRTVRLSNGATLHEAR